MFAQTTPEQVARLEHIMLDLAAGKVREAFSPATSAEASRYLVGARTKPREGPAPGTRIQPAAPPPPGREEPVAAEPSAPVAGPATPEPAAVDEPLSQQPAPAAPAAALPSAPAPAAAPAPAPPAPTAAPLPAGSTFRGKRLGEVLVLMRKLNEAQVAQAVVSARLAGLRLGKHLLREGLVTPEELCRALALQSGLPMTDLSTAAIPPHLARIFPFDLLARHEFVPIDDTRKMLCVAAANMLPRTLVAELERLCQRRVEVFLAEEDRVLAALDSLRPSERAHERIHARYAAVLPVTYQLCNRLGRLSEPTVYAGRTTDVSEGGLQIEGPAPRALMPDDVRRRGLCLRLTLSCEKGPIQALCDPRFIQVRNRPEPDALPWLIGLRFLEIRKDDYDRLTELCRLLRQRQQQSRAGPPGY
jgi:hypothetical protein